MRHLIYSFFWFPYLVTSSEIDFKLNFECNGLPLFIDQGVKLEVRLLPETTKSNNDWVPIKYYTISLVVPNYVSLVVLDDSGNSVTAQDVLYNSSLPLMNITTSSGFELLNIFIPIKEYICGPIVQNLTEYMPLEVRWQQRFGENTNTDFKATWILDDINISIWNGTSFLQALSENFNGNVTKSYNFTAANRVDQQCQLTSIGDKFLYFNGTTSENITRRSINAVTDPVEIFVRIEKSRNITANIILFNDGDPFVALKKLLVEYGVPLPQAISNMVIDSTRDALKNISSEADPDAGARVLKFLEFFALTGYNSSLGKVSNEIFTFQVIDVSPDDFMNPWDRLLVLNETEGTISLPRELFSIYFTENITDIRVVTFVYKNLSGILPVVTNDESTNTTLGSAVLSATLRCTNKSCSTSDIMLNNSVLIEIQHFKDTSDNDVPDIYFLDLVKNIWSSKGCKCNPTLSNTFFSICECNHLTHFAILLSPGVQFDDKNTFNLKIIGYVGITVSVFCMLATILILSFLKTLWGLRTFIHINLCVCLTISQVTFISAIDKNAIEELCQAIAIVLHYFFLTTFMWMLMEGVFLYVMLVQVFVKRQYPYVIGFTVVSYGLPALYVFCVMVPLGLTIKDDQGRPQYGTSNVSEACWLREDTHFNWAFISPVIIIIIVNFGFFIMAISIMWKHKKRETDKPQLKNAGNWLRTVISLMVVMGITWMIGVLVLNQVLLFVAYIFTIVTAFQGLFIFFLFVLLSKQVRDHYGTWWRSKKGEFGFLNKPFSTRNSSSWNIPKSNSSSETKKKSSSIGKEQAKAAESPRPMVTMGEILNHNGNIKGAPPNDYIDTVFTNKHTKDPANDTSNGPDCSSVPL